MDYFKLVRDFWDFCFENPEKIKPNHCALYLFAVEHCNRLGWRSKFGLPTTMVKEAVGIRSYNTYIQTLNDLIEYGFIEMVEKSKNQYSSNIVALSIYDKALDKALDKAFIKHDTKQSESTVQSIDSINKQYTINNIQYTIDEAFDYFWNAYDNKKDSKVCKDKFLKLPKKDIIKILEVVENYVKSTPDKKFRKNPKTWLNGQCWNDEININFNKQKNGTTKITDTIEFKQLVKGIRSAGERI